MLQQIMVLYRYEISLLYTVFLYVNTIFGMCSDEIC